MDKSISDRWIIELTGPWLPELDHLCIPRGFVW